MNYLDKYIITNKNSKFYGRHAWLVDMPDENDRARFIVDCGVKLRMKTSSVKFVSPRFPDGYRFRDRMFGIEYVVTRINWSHDKYRVKYNAALWETALYPWNVPEQKAKVV